MKNENQKSMELDTVTLALVLRLAPDEIHVLSNFINEAKLNVIYRATSYAPLYISKEEPQWK